MYTYIGTSRRKHIRRRIHVLHIVSFEHTNIRNLHHTFMIHISYGCLSLEERKKKRWHKIAWRHRPVQYVWHMRMCDIRMWHYVQFAGVRCGKWPFSSCVTIWDRYRFARPSVFRTQVFCSVAPKFPSVFVLRKPIWEHIHQVCYNVTLCTVRSCKMR